MLPGSTRSPMSRAALALATGLAFTLFAPIMAPEASGLAPAAKAQQPQPSQFQAILADYGTFQAHEKYGEVWVPARTTVPEGWHPYPACNWVHSKDLGWYFNDKTAWSKIVHHYGRWAHDKTLGWVWVKGEEFSPGWVVWRTSDKWVGWAPMPPEQDIKEISATEFNSDKHWTFMDAKTFGRSCDGGTTYVSQPSASYPVFFTETKLVTEVRFVHGISVFVLPPPLIINIVDIDIGIFPPWSPCFFGAWFWHWNVLVNNVVININFHHGPVCMPVVPKPMVKPLPIISTPPPPPGGMPKPERRADLPPPLRPIDSPVVKPERPTFPTIPPVVVIPERPQKPDRPSETKPDRPNFQKIPPVVIIPDRPQKPDRPSETKPDRPNFPKIPPIVIIPDRPQKPDRPSETKPNGPKRPPVIADIPRRSDRLSNLDLRSGSKLPDVARSSLRQPVPKLDRSAESVKNRVPNRNGPLIR